MAFNHGKDSYFNLDNAAGAPTDISAYVDEISFPQSADVAETTALGAAAKSYIGGLLDATFSLSGSWDATINAILVAAKGATKTYIYGPAGSGSGKVRMTGEAFCTSVELETGLDGAVRYSAEFQTTAGITTDTFS